MVRASTRSGKAKLFSRWYTELNGGKHVVVVVVTEGEVPSRLWIITVYLASKLTGGVVEWKRN